MELVTQLGDRLGRRARASVTLVECARTHLWKPLLHAVAAGSIDPGEYEVNYLAQAHWHAFRYLFGEIIGLDRARKEVRLAATFDDEGRQNAGAHLGGDASPPRPAGHRGAHRRQGERSDSAGPRARRRFVCRFGTDRGGGGGESAGRVAAARWA